MKSMAWERNIGVVCFIVLLLVVISAPVFAQNGEKESKGGIDWKIVIAAGGLLLAVITGVFFARTISKKKKTGELDAVDEHKIRGHKKCEKLYNEALRRELGRIGVMGPGFERIHTRIEETFTSLRISQYNREPHEHVMTPGGPAKETFHEMREIYLSPEKIMEQAFPKYRVLLLIGDPGSGKTTLLKYYTLACLEENHRRLGFTGPKILPLFLPLRELVFEGDTPVSLYENLETWAAKRHLDIPAAVFQYWLRNRPTLVLLDGLDEISDVEKRRGVCGWLDKVWAGLDNARFVLTSRPTGYRKPDDVELECPHLRGEIMDFTPDQQAQFLDRWFRAVYLDELTADAGKSEREEKDRDALDRARTIVAFLNKEENKGVRELARVPMLLQIMAIIWKNRDFLPETRWELYDVSLNYLLEYRDRRRDLKPVLPADRARKVLMPAALWMQEELRSDNAAKEKIHEKMQPVLNTFDDQPDARLFCENLRDRAGVIADYGTDNYIFRHKSFLEYLAALHLAKEVLTKSRMAVKLAEYFQDSWWEETLRFFIGYTDEKIFDLLMLRFFESDVSRELDARQQTLLQILVKDAPQKKIDSLVKGLNAGHMTDKQRRYIIDCLKTMGTPEALEALEAFVKRGKEDDTNVGLARDVVEESSEEYVIEFQPHSFRNPFEDHVEYIKIPGGTYPFSVSGQTETVPDIYFCKFPVTNKRYRKFIAYLEGKQDEPEQTLPIESFTRELLEVAKTVKAFSDYLGTDPGEWKEKFHSRYDGEKRFNGDDQPVVGVTWYAARAYCFWLSCLQKHDIVYRLPTGLEWEWAAAGRGPGGSQRVYPWEKSKGKPNPNLANYGKEVDATTPVGRYPDGATPEGLMDMAGNVWERMGNFYDRDENYYALRGGSWYDRSGPLRCVSRDNLIPHDVWNYVVGFRVVALPVPNHVET
ncbi:MAG: SUMF1/EgtB/PvdO family nonheme iron enzyme [bacterium]|nr:SUMF1/EgtB/PvdO family nonheme iron enzyme [bacterium]